MLGPVSDGLFAELMAALAPFETRPHLAVAVSGGADSLALAILAHRWATQRDGTVSALIVDHGLRPTSARESQATKSLLSGLGIDAHILPWRGAKPVTGIQAAARAARYDLLEAWCREQGVLHLLTGHHRDDQIETYAIRLASNSGPMGLSGMSPLREMAAVRLLRPLLSVPKTRLRDTVEKEGLSWIEDPSNHDRRFQRARLRTNDISEKDYRAHWDACQNHAVLRLDLERRLARVVAEQVFLSPYGFADFSPAFFQATEHQVLRAALGRLISCIGGRVYSPGGEALERLINALAFPAKRTGRTLGRCRFLPHSGGWRVVRERRHLPPPMSPTFGQRWDGRFQISGDLPEGAVIVPWGNMPGGPENSDIPRAARVSLPVLKHPDGALSRLLIACPGASEDSSGAKRRVTMSFSPLQSLSPSGYLLVSPPPRTMF
ncbi:MAG: tRNA lysidine(34) synthetase TilS [Magnetospiraceae bacterium]